MNASIQQKILFFEKNLETLLRKQDQNELSLKKS